MLEHHAAESMAFKEPSLCPEDSLQAEPQSSYPLTSDEKSDTEQQQEALVKDSAAIFEQDGSIGFPLESQSPTTSQSSTGQGSSLENAVTSSLELPGPPSSDISNISKEKQDCSPAQHEEDSSVVGGEHADSIARDGGETASLPPEEHHIALAGDASKGMEFADAQTNKNFIVNKITKIEDRLPLKPNGHHLHSNMQVPIQMKATESAVSTEHLKKVSENRGVVDTTAPFESVREAVSKFGGIVDWKVQKVLTIEKHKHINDELEKIQGGIPKYRKDWESAEVAKVEALNALDNTKRLVEELKLNLERAQTEEAQAKQDAQLAQLRAKEIDDGVADEASVASKAQLVVAKARHEAAVAELKSVQVELTELQEQSTSLAGRSDIATRRAEEALSASKEIEKEVESLTLELIAAKESLESAYATHLEAEERRMNAALARDKDCLNWDEKIKEAQEELCRINEQFMRAKDLKSKLIGASSLLADLKKELAAHMESQLKEQSQSLEEDESKGFQFALASKRKELEDVKANAEMAKNEVSILRVAESSLKSELEREKAELASFRQREEMALIAVSSLQAEIERTMEEIKQAIEKEKEARAKMVELPKLLQQAALEAEKLKSSAKTAREERRRVIEEVEQVKLTLSTAKCRLSATLKEIEAAGASERLALAAVKALQDSENAAAMGASPRGVTLSLEEYYTLSKRAHEAEELANERITSATARIQVAKVSELNSAQRLKEARREMDRREQELRIAKEKSNKAEEGKLGAEQELRKWRAEHEQRRRAIGGGQSASNPHFDGSFETKTAVSVASDAIHPTPGPKIYVSGDKMEHSVPEFKPRKKKSFFPHMVMFLARKRAQSRK